MDATQDPPGVGRSETTFGGLGTRDEMCINFLWYWPAENANAYCEPCQHADGSLAEEGHTSLEDSASFYIAEAGEVCDIHQEQDGTTLPDGCPGTNYRIDSSLVHFIRIDSSYMFVTR